MIEAVNGQQLYSLQFTNLGTNNNSSKINHNNLFPNSVPGVPYYVTIGAVNEAGQGENTTVIAFTAVKGTQDHVDLLIEITTIFKIFY